MRWAAVLLLAAALRLVSWSSLDPEDPASTIGDGDSLYHRFRAQQIAGDFPYVPWRDPLLGDGGIEVPWPPLFDVIVAGAAVLTYGEPTPTEVARAANWIPLAIGVATVPLVGWLAGILVGPELAMGAALLFALSVPHAFYSLLGRSDQHVLELFLTLAMLIAYARGIGARAGRERWAMALVLGAAVALSFWNWLGSALNLLFLAAFVSAWHVLAPRDAPRATAPAALLAAGCLFGALVLAATLVLFGPAGALLRTSVLGVTGLHVLLVAGTGVVAAGLWWARTVRPDAPAWGRLAELLLVALAPVIASSLVPGALDGIWRGLTALFRANAWYASIGEFQPLLFGGQEPLRGELANALLWYGLAPFLAFAGAAALRDRWRAVTSVRPEVLLLGVWGAVSFVLAVFRYRFALYAGPPLAIWSWLGIRFAQERWFPGLARGGIGKAFIVTAIAAATAAPTVAFVKTFAFAVPRPSPAPLLLWLRDRVDTAEARAVYARWDQGHHVRVLSGRPAVANPFGTEGGETGFYESLRVFLSTGEPEVEDVLRRRRAGYLLSEDPRRDVLAYQDLLPPGSPRVAKVSSSWRRGRTLVETERYRELVSYRLHEHDGSAAEGVPALGGFRLLKETAPTDPVRSGRPAYALFGFVKGARLSVRGGAPGCPITAELPVRTNTGRAFTWRTNGTVDSRGSAVLRIPYATGANGESVAGSVLISACEKARWIEIPEGAVVSGGALPVDLGGSGAPSR